MDAQDRTGRLGPCHAPVARGLPHHLKCLGLKTITTGTKAGWLQQLINAISHATFKEQVPLHNAGVVFTYHELTLKGKMYRSWALQPLTALPLLSLTKLSPQTHRPGTTAGERDSVSIHGSELAQVG